MISTVSERPLGPEAVQWIRRGLFGTRLGARIVAQYSLDSGVVVAVLPEKVSNRQALSFETGGLVPPSVDERSIVLTHPTGSTSHLVPKPNTDGYLVSRIQEFLHRSPTSACLFEDQVSQPGDPFVSPDRGTIVIVDGVVYHILNSKRDDSATVMATIRAAKKGIHMMLGVLASAGVAEDGSSLDLEQVVLALDTIIVDAYDGESYLMWRPSGGCPGPC
jgi:hypothetical protein